MTAAIYALLFGRYTYNTSEVEILYAMVDLKLQQSPIAIHAILQPFCVRLFLSWRHWIGFLYIACLKRLGVGAGLH